MKVLIVGEGAREHALALMAAASSSSPRIGVAGSHVNPGLRRVVEQTGGRYLRAKPTEPAEVVRAAEEYSPDLVVIGPEEPLFHGVADALRDAGFTVFGPSSRAAMIEKDKVFARELMWRHRIPGRLRFRGFRDPGEAAEYARAMGDVVVKPARQAGGRGVRVFARPLEHLETGEEAGEYAARLAGQVASRYSDVESLVIVEERVDGVEYTVTVVSDGSTVVPLPAAQDHPHLHPFDTGPETGGMGALAGPGETLSFIEPGEYRETVSILEATLKALREETGAEYRGALSGQMMLTGLWGPTVIEYYARFGDPEAGTLIPLIASDFLELLDRAASGRLAGYKLEVRDDVYVVSKAVAPEGYPLDRARARGHPVALDPDRVGEGCVLLVGSAAEEDGRVVTLGSRLAEVVCWSRHGYSHASRMVEEVLARGAVRSLDGSRLVHRWDIGEAWLVAERVRAAEEARASYRRRREKGLWRVYDWVPGRGLVEYDYSPGPLYGG